MACSNGRLSGLRQFYSRRAEPSGSLVGTNSATSVTLFSISTKPGLNGTPSAPDPAEVENIRAMTVGMVHRRV